ncbi:protein of unknown function [Methylocaldum szegediense]|uniref:Transposase n=1 Tax=Methylocaldum szegediense TaxID=73780 RepID=A0ABN8X8X5_9GAMM|nr:protein of unknown function [Methylocaldum szegediense]
MDIIEKRQISLKMDQVIEGIKTLIYKFSDSHHGSLGCRSTTAWMKNWKKYITMWHISNLG